MPAGENREAERNPLPHWETTHIALQYVPAPRKPLYGAPAMLTDQVSEK